MVTIEESDARVFDADGRIAVDLPCVHCQYNLRTLAGDGNCPECGARVWQSTQARSLRFANTEWVGGPTSGPPRVPPAPAPGSKRRWERRRPSKRR